MGGGCMNRVLGNQNDVLDLMINIKKLNPKVKCLEL